jgi:hypothetical protein
MVGGVEREHKTYLVNVKDNIETEVNKLLTWMPDDLEEEHGSSSSEEKIEVLTAVDDEKENTSVFPMLEKVQHELPLDRVEVVDATNDEPGDGTVEVQVKSFVNKTVRTNFKAYLGVTENLLTLQSSEAEKDDVGSPENKNKEKQENTGFTSLIGASQSLNQTALPGSHFLGFNSVKTTSTTSEQSMLGALCLGSAASATIKLDSGHVKHNYSNSTLNFPDVSQRPGVEMRGDRRQGRLPQLRRKSDKEDCTGARTPGTDATRHLLPHEGTRAFSSTRGEELD